MLADLRTYVLASGAVSSLIGSRMYPTKLQQTNDDDDFPAVTYQVISEIRGYTMEGVDGLPGTRVQIDAWGTSYASALDVAEAIRARLEAFSGLMGASTTVQGIFIDTMRTEYESEPELHRISRDYFINHEE